MEQCDSFIDRLMKDYIRTLLERHGPSLSSDLIKHMVDEGIAPATARKRLNRSKADIKMLAGLTFEKRARFVYLEEQFGDERFWNALERAFKTNGKSYWGAVAGLKSRGGSCPKSHFPIVCGAPVNRKSQLSPDRILERLKAINLLEETEAEGFSEPIVSFVPYHYQAQELHYKRAVLLAEYIAVHAIHEWARRVGFGSYGKFKLRNGGELPLVSSIAWDISAPSYIRPLVSARSGILKPGFFVCDVNLNGSVDQDAVHVFIRKHDMASAPQNVAPIIPFYVADSFMTDAFDAARSAGIIATTIGQLFGDGLSEALKGLVQLLTDAGATAAVNPGKLEQVLNELTRIEGAAQNLRGDLFELVVGNMVKEVEGGYLTTGKEITDYKTGKKAEIDVLLDLADEKSSLVVECKAKSPGSKVSLAEVKKWYLKRAPLIAETLRQIPQYKDKQFRFELWSTGFFHPAALNWLREQETKYDGYTLLWRDGIAVKKYSKKVKSRSISNILKQHYFNHPLTKLS